MNKLTVSACLLLACAPVSAADWRYDAALYAWLTGVDGTLAAGNVEDQPVQATFSDLVEFLDFAVAGHFEARNPKVVLLADVFYVELAGGRDAEVGNVPVEVDLDYEQWIAEIGGGYRASEHVDLLLVGRYYRQDTGTTVSSSPDAAPAQGDTSHAWGDGFVGARYSTTFAEKWLFSVRADIGAGGSDLAWFGNVGVGYQFTELFSMALGYRILSLDYETGSGADYYSFDAAFSGVGTAFRFDF
jgi:hypothetical protein